MGPGKHCSDSAGNKALSLHYHFQFAVGSRNRKFDDTYSGKVNAHVWCCIFASCCIIISLINILRLCRAGYMFPEMHIPRDMPKYREIAVVCGMF